MATALDALTTDTAVVDQRDMTRKYNTKLSPAEEAKFKAKYPNESDSYDYDLRGAWKAGSAKSDNGHLPDTFKKPNHPTFSDESKYHGVDSHEGGTWAKEGEKWTFTPSKTNLDNMSADELKAYFQSVEPDAVLKLPEQK